MQACGDDACVRWDPSPWVWILVLVPVAMAVTLGIGMVVVRRTDESRRRLERTTRWATTIAVLAVLTFWLVPALVLRLVHIEGWIADRLGFASVSTLTLLAALIAQVAASSGKADSPVGTVSKFLRNVAGKLRPILIKVAAVVVGPLLVIGLALSFMVSGATSGFRPLQLWIVIALAAWLVIVGLGGDLNEWSLHPYYREQLRSAFAVNPRLATSPFDPLPWPRDDRLQDINRTPGPDLVICAAANVADDRLTAPGRPAVSWTFSR